MFVHHFLNFSMFRRCLALSAHRTRTDRRSSAFQMQLNDGICWKYDERNTESTRENNYSICSWFSLKLHFCVGRIRITPVFVRSERIALTITPLFLWESLATACVCVCVCVGVLKNTDWNAKTNDVDRNVCAKKVILATEYGENGCECSSSRSAVHHQLGFYVQSIISRSSVFALRLWQNSKPQNVFDARNHIFPVLNQQTIEYGCVRVCGVLHVVSRRDRNACSLNSAATKRKNTFQQRQPAVRLHSGGFICLLLGPRVVAVTRP